MSSVFHMSDEGENQKTQRLWFLSSSSCLRGVRTWRGEDDNDHRSLSSFVFHRNHEGQNKKDTMMTALCCHLHVWKEGKEEEAKTITITYCCCCRLFFIRSMKAKNKRHEYDGSNINLLRPKGARIRGGKDNDNHRSSSSFVFHRNDEGQKQKTNMTTSIVIFCVRKEQQ
jgi:hypothetical protein